MNFDLDKTLLDLSGRKGTFNWTIRDAVEGVQIFGGIGSGKTSGSGRLLALKYLSNNFGGCVLTVKQDEVDLWRDYCRLTNRTGDLIVLEPDGRYFFNFLEYESIRKSSRKFTENIVQVIKTVIRASEEKAGGKTDDPFWETALDMLMFHIIDLCIIAYGKISVQLLYDIAQSVPKLNDGKKELEADNAFNRAFNKAKSNVFKQIDEWYESLPDQVRTAPDFDSKRDQLINDEVPDARVLQFIDQFFLETLKNLGDKTRSIIDFSFTGFLFRLLQDPVYSMFCKQSSNVLPEDCLDGKIILINLPVKVYNKVGRDTQILFKYIWQRAMEKRQVSKNERPVFLWADEAQNFLHEYDAEYQATARSSRIATVYISQNLPNYLANMGGTKSEYKVKSFLGTLGTKIFHANADIETNNFASDLIGEAYQREESYSSATTEGITTVTTTVATALAQLIRPEEFVKLKTGGPINKYKVSGIIHVQGKLFDEEQSHKKVFFNQNSNITTL